MIGQKVIFRATNNRGEPEQFLRQGTIMDKTFVFISEKYLIQEHVTNTIYHVGASQIKQVLIDGFVTGNEIKKIA